MNLRVGQVRGSPEILLVASAGWPTGSGTPDGAVLALTLDADGHIGPVEAAVPAVGCSYLNAGPNGGRVYASCRWPQDPNAVDVERTHPGEVVGIEVGPGALLTVVNRQPTAGRSPCHLSVDANGCHLLVADYQDGLIDVHPLDESGAIGETCAVVPRSGCGPDSDRQQSSHVHMVHEHTQGGWILATDLGTDEVAAYAMDHRTGSLSPVTPTARVVPGSGPRHYVALRPDMLLVATELRAGVTVVKVDPRSGGMHAGAVFSTSRNDNAAPSAIALAPDRRHLYVGNRGADTIGVLRIGDGRLMLIDEIPCAGQPRDFGFVGNHLYVANQESDTLAVLPYDARSGRLGAPSQVLELPAPSRVLSYRREKDLVE